jgi:hypothetical protein
MWVETIGEHVIYCPPIETSKPGFKSVGHHSSGPEESHEISELRKGGMAREGYEL